MSTSDAPQTRKSAHHSSHTASSDGEHLHFAPPRWLTTLTLIWLAIATVTQLIVEIVGPPANVSPIGTQPLLISAGVAAGVLLLGFAAVATQAWLMKEQTTGALRGGGELPSHGKLHRNSAERRFAVLLNCAALVGALTSATMMLVSALILLDLVSAILPGIGTVFYPAGTLIRLSCAIAAVLIGVHTWKSWSAVHARTHRSSLGLFAQHWTAGNRWVMAVGYLTVIACLTRLGAQLVVGLDTNPLNVGPAMKVFEAGFLLAGVLLPLALVHSWGRIWPGWVPGLHGRRVPRRLLITCGSILGVGMVAYFGIVFGQMVFERLNGRNPFPQTGVMDLPEAFFWVSVPAYLVWGLGLVVCTISYTLSTNRDGFRA